MSENDSFTRSFEDIRNDLWAAIQDGRLYTPDDCPLAAGTIRHLENPLGPKPANFWIDIRDQVKQSAFWANSVPVDGRELADFLQACAKSGAVPEDTGITIAGLYIKNDVFLYNADFGFPLRLLGCRIESLIRLRQSQTRTIDLRASYLNEFDGRRLVINGDAVFEASCIRDTASLEGARVGGWVDFTTAEVKLEQSDRVVRDNIVKDADEPAIALRLNNLDASHDLRLRNTIARGCVVLENASVGSRLMCMGAKIYASQRQGDDGDPDQRGVRDIAPHDSTAHEGFSIKGRGLKVKANVDFTDAEFHGEVRLPSMEAGGFVDFTRVTCFGSGGKGLLLDFSRMQEDVSLTDFVSFGCVRMHKVQVSGDLLFERTSLRRPHWTQYRALNTKQSLINGNSLRLSGAAIDGEIWINECDFFGTVSLTNVEVKRRFRIRRSDFQQQVLVTAIDASFLKAGADLSFAGVTIIGSIEMQDASVEGAMLMLANRLGEEVRAFKVDGLGLPALMMRRVSVGGDFRIDNRSERFQTPLPKGEFEILGQVLLTSSTIGGELRIGNGICRAPVLSNLDRCVSDRQDDIKTLARNSYIWAAIAARTLHVGRGVIFERGFSAEGEVRFIEADVGDDFTVRKATMTALGPDETLRPRELYALRLDRAKIGGTIGLGVSQQETDDSNQSRQPGEADFQSFGSISLAGAQINGHLRIDSARIEASPTPLWNSTETMALEVVGTPLSDAPNVPKGLSRDKGKYCALRAELIFVEKNLYLGMRRLDIRGQVDLSGARINGMGQIRYAVIHGPARPKYGDLHPQLAFLSEHLKVGLDLDIMDSVVAGGVTMSQADIGGTCHIDGSIFVAPDALNEAKVSGFVASGLNTVARERGRIAFRCIRATFGRSLKWRSTARAFGVIDMTAAYVANDMEFWLKILQPPAHAQEALDVLAKSAGTNRPSEIMPMRKPASAHAPVSALLAYRAASNGPFFLGHSADLYERSGADGKRNGSENIDDNYGGTLDLTDVSVSILKDSERSWPDSGKLNLDGFDYDRFDESKSVPIQVSKRIRWLKLSFPANTQERDFEISPALLFDQLATTYRTMGLYDHSENVIAAKEFRKIWFGGKKVAIDVRNWIGELPTFIGMVVLFPIRLVIWLFYGLLIKYGYKPVRAGIVLTIWVILGFYLGTLVEGQFQSERMVEADGREYRVIQSCILPSQEEYYVSYAAVAGFGPTSEALGIGEDEYLFVPGYPVYNSFLYALDSVIPVDLGARSYWYFSESERCSVRGQLPYPQFWETVSSPFGEWRGNFELSFRSLDSFLYRVIGQILFAIAAVALTGLLEPRIERTKVQSRNKLDDIGAPDK